MLNPIAVVIIAGLFVPAQAPDPCKLLTTAEIAAVVGSTPPAGRTSGPRVDEELRGTGWSCDMFMGDRHFVITVVEFATPAAAVNGMGVVLRMAQETDGTIPLSPAPDMGESGVFGATDEGATSMVLKGRYMLNLTYAAELADPPQLRGPMKRLISLALSRLSP